ncbi:replication factor RFC1, partial [Helicosporidium sp. ATCC 50920]
LAALAKAADAFSAGDVVSRRVRSAQEWSLAPLAACLSSVMPATYSRGGREPFGLYPGEPNFPRFTAWLGSNSSAGKQRRLLGELHSRMAGGPGCGVPARKALRLEVMPLLRTRLSLPLARQGKEGVPEVLGLMTDYNLGREECDFVADVQRWKTKAPWAEDPLKDVPAATKSALTRAFNALHLRSRLGIKAGPARKRGAAGSGGGAEDDGDEGDEGAEEEEEEEDKLDPMVVKQKLAALRHSGLSLTLKDGGETVSVKGKGRGGKATSARGGKAASARAASGKAASGRGRAKSAG